MRYQAEALPAAEMYQVERHLLSCEFCSDALEGLSLLQPRQQEAALDDLKARLAQRIAEGQEKRALPYKSWAIAASVGLFLLSVATFLILNLKEANQQSVARQSEPVNRRSESIDQQPAPETGQSDMEVTMPIAKNAESKGNSPLAEAEVFEITAPAEEVISPSPQKPLAAVPAPEKKPMLALEQAETESEAEIVAEKPEITPSLTEALSGKVAGVQVSEAKKKTTTAPPVVISKPEATDYKTAENSSAEYSRSAPAVANTNRAKAESRVVKGVVKDASTGEPLPGVNVRIKGTSSGTVTDIDGNYTIHLPAAEAQLSFNFIGYLEKTIAVKDPAKPLSAELEPDVQTLSEVVVIGYGTQKRHSITGAVSSISAPSTEPVPSGGQRRFNRYISKNLRYPAAAAQANMEGEVALSFFVEPNGTISQPEVVQSAGYGMDEEAIRLLLEGPKWQPATNAEGEAIRQRASIRVAFKLDKK